MKEKCWHGCGGPKVLFLCCMDLLTIQTCKMLFFYFKFKWKLGQKDWNKILADKISLKMLKEMQSKHITRMLEEVSR